MKKLVLVALTAMVAMTTGCIIESGDDTGDDGEDAFITAKWSIKNLATNDNTLPCPPNINTAAVYSQPVDANNNPVGSPIIDLFTCSDKQGVTDALDPDVYQSWVELTSGSGGSVYAKSLSAIVDVTAADKTFETTILEDGGYFQLTWTLFDATTNADLTCAQASAADVTVLSTINGGSTSYDDQYTCEDHYGVTGGMLAGTYVVSIDALNSAGVELNADPVNLNNKVVLDKNGVTDLGNVDIPIE